MAEAAKKEEDQDEKLEIEIEIEEPDDPPEKKEDAPKAKEEGKEDSKDDDTSSEEDEAAQYSEAVQKRIKKLTYEKHEATRQREAAEREREEAIRATKAIYDRAQELEKRIKDQEGLTLKESESRAKAEVASAQAKLTRALEEGDTTGIVEAQTQLSTASSTLASLAGRVPREESSHEQTPKMYQQSPQVETMQRPRIPEPTQSMKDWHAENEWFNSDRRMTAYAMAVHEDLVKGGVQPDSKEYYGLIDKEMRQTFPSKFPKLSKEGEETKKDEGLVVAPPSRSSARKSRTVRLTASEAAIAKRLGVPPEKYAEQLLLRDKNDD